MSVVLVYPQLNSTINKPAHTNMFNNLIPAAVSCVEKIELSFNSPFSARSATHITLEMIRNRVKDIVKRRPDDYIFLAGWGISSLLNMQALRRVAGVNGVLNFGFPMRNYNGVRGVSSVFDQ